MNVALGHITRRVTQHCLYVALVKPRSSATDANEWRSVQASHPAAPPLHQATPSPGHAAERALSAPDRREHEVIGLPERSEKLERRLAERPRRCALL